MPALKRHAVRGSVQFAQDFAVLLYQRTDSATNCNRNEDTNTRCGAFDQLKTKSNARDERSLYNNIMQRRECPPKQRNRSSLLQQSKMGRKTNKPEAKTRPQHISAGTSSLIVDRKL